MIYSFYVVSFHSISVSNRYKLVPKTNDGFNEVQYFLDHDVCSCASIMYDKQFG